MTELTTPTKKSQTSSLTNYFDWCNESSNKKKKTGKVDVGDVTVSPWKLFAIVVGLWTFSFLLGSVAGRRIDERRTGKSATFEDFLVIYSKVFYGQNDRKR